MKEEVIQLVAEILEISPVELSLDSSIGDFPQWDSLRHLTIIQSIQERYNITISPKERLMIESVEDLINAVNKKK